MTPDRHREGRDTAEPVFAQGAMVTDKERCEFFAWVRRLHHLLDEIVIRVGFVGETLAVLVHGDHAGLRAIDEVRHDAR